MDIILELESYIVAALFHANLKDGEHVFVEMQSVKA